MINIMIVEEIDGHIIAYDEKTVFLVQSGVHRGKYKTHFTIKGNYSQAYKLLSSVELPKSHDSLRIYSDVMSPKVVFKCHI